MHLARRPQPAAGVFVFQPSPAEGIRRLREISLEYEDRHHFRNSRIAVDCGPVVTPGLHRIDGRLGQIGDGANSADFRHLSGLTDGHIENDGAIRNRVCWVDWITGRGDLWGWYVLGISDG